MTRLNASRGDLLRKDGVKFDGNVNILRELVPVPLLNDPTELSQTRVDLMRSILSVDIGRNERCLGYHPL